MSNKEYLPERELKWLGIDMSTITGVRLGRIKFNCEYCGNESTKPRAWFKRAKHNFCSEVCADLFQKKSITKQCSICGDNFSVRPSEAARFSTCENPECRKSNKTGENNPNYRHGRAYENGKRPVGKDYKDWREAVFKRDNHTCQICGKRGGDLNADHIRPWAYFQTLRYDVANGRTLCVPCHRTTYKAVLGRKERAGELGVDFDKTIAESSYPTFEIGKPLPGAVEALQELYRRGWKVVIYTARPWVDYKKIEDWCIENEVPTREIICGKPLFKYMIDDRNIEFKGDWPSVLDKVK